MENEVANARVLASRFADGTLDDAPIWTDLRTFAGEPWRERVHCVVAGYPCQPFSVAGRKQGRKDKRHLWPHVARIIDEVEPDLVFIENVANHFRLGFPEVRRDLRSMGYEVAAGEWSAAEVGAAHLRKRLFALAVYGGAADVYQEVLADVGDAVCWNERRHRPAGSDARIAVDRSSGAVAVGESRGCGELRQSPGCDGLVDRRGPELADTGCVAETRDGESLHGRQHADGAGAEGGSATLADCDRSGLAAQLRPLQGRESDAQGSNAALAESSGERRTIRPRQRDDGGEEFAPAEGESLALYPFAPGPEEDETWARVLSISGTEGASLEPAIRRAPDGAAARVDRLRALGNGVVPLVAAVAFRTLLMAHIERGRDRRMSPTSLQ